MKNILKKMTGWAIISLSAIFSILFFNTDSVMAEEYGLTMVPMNQSIIVDPGDSYEVAFKISNPSGSTRSTYYKIEVEPFYQNDDGRVVYSAEGERSDIVKWATISVPAFGELLPNDVKEVIVTISVPESAPAGGQYFAVNVTAGARPLDEEDSSSDSIDDENGATIKEVKRMSHLVYAEITGSTLRRGEIVEASLPGFLLSGRITGSASVKNTGNVHGEAKYVLKVFPLFSDEELYTNEEKPSTSTILPDRTVYHAVSWDETPTMGIFNVVYTVEFEGAKAEISKMVIICPLWLLFVIIFVIAMIIMWLIMKAKSRRKE